MLLFFDTVPRSQTYVYSSAIFLNADLIQNTELSVAKACEKMEANPIYSSESPIYDVIVDTPMLRSLPREPQRKTDMDPGQYVELSVNGVSEKMTRNDSMSVESNKLAECCASRQVNTRITIWTCTAYRKGG